MSRETREIFEFGDFRLDVDEHRLEYADGRTNGILPEKAFRTLVELVRSAGTLLTKDQLLSAVWTDAVVEPNNLGKAIHGIRQFLGDEGRHAHSAVGMAGLPGNVSVEIEVIFEIA